MCRPEVIGAYPVSPQTHIVEGLSAIVEEAQALPGVERILEATRSLLAEDRAPEPGPAGSAPPSAPPFTTTAPVDVDRGCFACMLGGPGGTTLFLVAAEWSGDESMVGGEPTGRIVTVEAPAPGAGRP